MSYLTIENPDKISRRSESFDENRNNVSIIGSTLRGTTPSVEYKQFYHTPRILPSITTSAKAEHRRSLFCYKNKLKEERKRKTAERRAIVSPKNKVNHNFHEANQKSSNERNLNSSNGQLMVSLGLATEPGGRFPRSSYNYSDIAPMASEHYNRETGSFAGPKSPAPPYPKPLTLSINPRNEENTDPHINSGQIMYPNNNRFTNRFRKDNWQTVKKSTRKVFPKVRKASTGCCSTYVATVKNIQSKWSLLFLVHCSLFLMLAGYVVIGASMLMKTDEGVRYAVRGGGELHRTKDIRGIAAERLLNISLKSVVEKSRDAVLDTIFTSDTLQAALAAFKTSRVAFLPADHELELLSQSVLEDWEKRLDYLLVRYHFISTIETMGYQMSPEELRIAWGPVDNSEKPHIPMMMPWNFGDASMQCFCLITTMGFTSKSPSDGGKAAAIIYAIFGIPLYWWVVFIWSQRLLDALLVVTRTSANTSNRRKIAVSEEDRILSPNWNSSPYKKESPPFLIFLSATLTIAYVIGLGPLACGTGTNSFGERLEAAFFSLLTVRPPASLPRGIETVLGFILYILNGHLMIGAFIRSVKMVGDSFVNRLFSSPTR